MRDSYLSICITAHNEGIVAHKTMLSVLHAIEPLDAAEISYEILIHIDKGDEETIDYFNRYVDNPLVRIFHNSFGDPGKSRNFLAKEAVGKYVAVLDADDLVSENWYIDSVRLLDKTVAPVVVHPEASLTFGIQEHPQVLCVTSDSEIRTREALTAFKYNRWISCLATHRIILLETPYQLAGNGFGYEDWHFNCETLAKGIAHLVVPNSILFYRRKAQSVLNSHNNSRTVLTPTALFNTDFLKSIPVSPVSLELHNYKDFIRRIAKRAFLSVRYYPVIGNVAQFGARALWFMLKTLKSLKMAISSLGRALWSITARAKSSGSNDATLQPLVPHFVIDAWKAANSIENQLCPTPDAIHSLIHYRPEGKSIGLRYRNIVGQVSHNPDYLLIVPWLVIGGADKVVLNYVNAIQTAHPEWHIAVITTLPAENLWANHLPDDVDFIDFGNASVGTDEHDRDLLFSSFIVQTGVKRLHIVNSKYGYQWVASHKDLINGNGYTLNISVFCYGLVEKVDCIVSYIDPYLTEIFHEVNQVFTDNKYVIDWAVANNAVDPDKFAVHYQPIDLKLDDPKPIDSNRPLRVLWASRVCLQKRPDLLREIAKKLNPKDFQVDVYGRIDGAYSKRYFANIDSLTYRGEFNGVDSLPTQNYDVFLYTSSIDGMPNIPLEMTGKGLPIVASNAGGLGEFIINGKTGFLVEDIDDVDQYVENLQYLKDHPQEAVSFVINAQELLKTQHNFSQFEQVVTRDI